MKSNLKQLKEWIYKVNIAPLFSIVFAFIIGGIIVAISGNSPIEVYKLLIYGAFGSSKGILQTILQSTPLLFSGLAVFLGLKGGILNLGVEGQLYMGALFSAASSIYIKFLPSPIHLLVSIMAGMLGGMLWSFLPIWLKIKKGAHEVVTALMMNYIAILSVDYLLNYPMRAADSSVAQTEIIQPTAQLARLFPRSKVTIAIIIGIVIAIALNLLLKKTILGYKITIVGSNRKAAAASGIHVNRTMIVTMLISGMCAGLAGSMEVMGTYYRLVQGFSSGYGFEGIAVAVLGRSPISVIFSAIIFGALKAGGIMLNFGTNLSSKFITVLQGIIIVLISAPMMALNYKKDIQKMFRQRGKS